MQCNVCVCDGQQIPTESPNNNAQPKFPKQPKIISQSDTNFFWT